ncbi:hypothetical protein ILYODFUR_035381, partial [Ilyodon furcidens]
WQGNGYSCQDVDECLTNNGGCSTTPVVQCLNTMGSFHCGPCPPGYEGDGRTCTQTNVCSSNNGGCHHLASCSSNPGSAFPVCTCPQGYTGNGYGPTGCTQTSNICQTNNPCVNGQCTPLSTVAMRPSSGGKVSLPGLSSKYVDGVLKVPEKFLLAFNFVTIAGVPTSHL